MQRLPTEPKMRLTVHNLLVSMVAGCTTGSLRPTRYPTLRTEISASTSPTTNMTETREHVKPIPEVEVAEEVVPIELRGCPVASIRRAAESV